MKQELWLSFRLAVRELRGGLSGFYVLIACIMLGVAAITTVGILSSAFRDGLVAKGRVILGGDMSFSLVHQKPSREQGDFIARFGATSHIVTMRSIARLENGKRSVLVGVKGVDRNYPLVGTFAVKGGGDLASLLHQGKSALVDQLLLQRLLLSVGDSFLLGTVKIKVAGVIAKEPDRLSGRLNFGPRVLISNATLAQTGLVQPGSLIRYSLRLKVPPTQEMSLAQIKKQIKQRFPQAGFSVLDYTNPTPQMKRATDRFGQFLALLSLAALFIGGVGVANAVGAHISGKRETIATFKSLGASSRVIFMIYLSQILLLAALGIVLGLVLGTITPYVISFFIGGALPVKLQLELPWDVLGLSTLYGFLVALIFMLWPLGSARRIKAAELYRAQVTTGSIGPGWPVIFLVAFCIALLTIVVIWVSPVKVISIYVCLAFALLYAFFAGLGRLLQWGFQHLPRPRNTELALVRASLSSPIPLVRTLILSLGIGLSLLMTVSMVQSSLMAELKTGLPDNAPNFFVLDIDKSDLQKFRQIATRTAPGILINEAPMLRGRLIELAGKPAGKVKASPNAQWVLRGDRGLTFSQTVPKGSVLTKGKWWPKNYDGPPLVSFEEKIAKGLGLKLGDMITVNVLGRDIEAKISSFREVKWESLSINFVMAFSPNTLENAPYKLLATLALKDRNDVEREGRLISELVTVLPDITPVPVREALAAVEGILKQLLKAVRAANLVLLLVGAIALAGALAATHAQRVRDTVIFKVLGATRKRILIVHLLEYTLLALLSIWISLAFGVMAAYAIVHFAMEIDFSFSLVGLLEMIALVFLLILPLGLIGSWRILGQKSTVYLRQA